jgi:hypothetical protein
VASAAYLNQLAASDPEVASFIELDGMAALLSMASVVNSDGAVTVDLYGEAGINRSRIAAVNMEAGRAIDSDVMKVVADLVEVVEYDGTCCHGCDGSCRLDGSNRRVRCGVASQAVLGAAVGGG